MENLNFGLEIMVIGFSVVIISLYLLYLILLGFNRCCVQPVKPEAQRKNITNVPPEIMEETRNAPVAAAVSHNQQSYYGTAPEIVAAITAAVSVCLDVPASEFEIVSVESVQPVPATQYVNSWAIAGRQRLMEKRQDLAMFRRERR